ncbi:hypothetical protein ACN95_14275 [Gordonia sihwensis]|nr:hypothetical protein [Gordonia sihwensis]
MVPAVGVDDVLKLVLLAVRVQCARLPNRCPISFAVTASLCSTVSGGRDVSAQITRGAFSGDGELLALKLQVFPILLVHAIDNATIRA